MDSSAEQDLSFLNFLQQLTPQQLDDLYLNEEASLDSPSSGQPDSSSHTSGAIHREESQRLRNNPSSGHESVFPNGDFVQDPADFLGMTSDQSFNANQQDSSHTVHTGLLQPDPIDAVLDRSVNLNNLLQNLDGTLGSIATAARRSPDTLNLILGRALAHFQELQPQELRPQVDQSPVQTSPSPVSSPRRPLYQCRLCRPMRGRTYTTRGTFKRHVNDHQPEFKYPCPLHFPTCTWVGNRRDKVHEHARNVHGHSGKVPATLINNLIQPVPHPRNCALCSKRVSSWERWFSCICSHCGTNGRFESDNIAGRPGSGGRGGGRGGGGGGGGGGGFNLNTPPGLGNGHGNQFSSNFGHGSNGRTGNGYMNPNAPQGYIHRNANPDSQQSPTDVSDIAESPGCSIPEQGPGLTERRNHSVSSPLDSVCGDNISPFAIEDSQSEAPSPSTLPDEDQIPPLFLSDPLEPNQQREPKDTIESKCRTCGHAFDGCSKCQHLNHSLQFCHQCADTSAQIAGAQSPNDSNKIWTRADTAESFSPTVRQVSQSIHQTDPPSLGSMSILNDMGSLGCWLKGVSNISRTDSLEKIAVAFASETCQPLNPSLATVLPVHLKNPLPRIPRTDSGVSLACLPRKKASVFALKIRSDQAAKLPFGSEKRDKYPHERSLSKHRRTGKTCHLALHDSHSNQPIFIAYADFGKQISGPISILYISNSMFHIAFRDLFYLEGSHSERDCSLLSNDVARLAAGLNCSVDEASRHPHKPGKHHSMRTMINVIVQLRKLKASASETRAKIEEDMETDCAVLGPESQALMSFDLSFDLTVFDLFSYLFGMLTGKAKVMGNLVNSDIQRLASESDEGFQKMKTTLMQIILVGAQVPRASQVL